MWICSQPVQNSLAIVFDSDSGGALALGELGYAFSKKLGLQHRVNGGGVPSGFGRAPFWARRRLSLFKIARKDLRTRARGAGGEHISSYLRPFPSSQHSHRVCDQISLSLLLRPWRKPRRTSPHRRPRRPRQVHRPVHHPRSPPLCPPHRLRPPPRPHRRAREGSSIGE